MAISKNKERSVNYLLTFLYLLYIKVNSIEILIVTSNIIQILNIRNVFPFIKISNKYKQKFCQIIKLSEMQISQNEIK